MEQKLVLTISVAKGDHVFSYNMPIGSPLQAAYDVLGEIQQEIVAMSKKSEEAAQKAEETARQRQEEQPAPEAPAAH